MLADVRALINTDSDLVSPPKYHGRRSVPTLHVCRGDFVLPRRGNIGNLIKTSSISRQKCPHIDISHYFLYLENSRLICFVEVMTPMANYMLYQELHHHGEYYHCTL